MVDPLNIWDLFAFGDGVETNIQEGHCNSGWFKLTVYMHFLDAEAALGIVSLDLFDRFDRRLDSLVLGHQNLDEIDVMADYDKERDTVDEHEISG